MSDRSRDRRGGAAAGLALLGSALLGLVCAADGAAAGCVRQIVNRSSAVLVARRDGGPPVTILPGGAVPIRLSHPGEIALAAYCGVPGPDGALASATFAYEAVLDRCFIRFGNPLFTPQLGRGFFGTQGTAPFTLNDPRQGDLILGPFATPACPVLTRRG